MRVTKVVNDADVRGLRADAADGRARCAASCPAEGAELVDVCPLCQEIALEAGWVKEGAPTTPTIERRASTPRKRGLAGRLGLTRATDEEPLAQQEPILRRLSDGEVALLEAADLFNGSAYRRTVGGIAKSLGEPRASIVPLSGTSGELAVTVAWELSWYQYRVSPDSAQPVRLERRGHELEELEPGLQGLERAGRGRGPARPRDRSSSRGSSLRGTSRASGAASCACRSASRRSSGTSVPA